MQTARAITQRYQDMQVLNLSQLVHRHGDRGPYLVTQDGSDPGDPTMRQCTFVLTTRGTWLHFYVYLALADPVRQRFTQFATVQAALQCVESLPADVVVETTASLQAMIEAVGPELEAVDPEGAALRREVRKRRGLDGKEHAV